MLVFAADDQMVAGGDTQETTDVVVNALRIQQQECRPRVTERLADEGLPDQVQPLAAAVHRDALGTEFERDFYASCIQGDGLFQVGLGTLCRVAEHRFEAFEKTLVR